MPLAKAYHLLLEDGIFNATGHVLYEKQTVVTLESFLLEGAKIGYLYREETKAKQQRQLQQGAEQVAKAQAADVEVALHQFLDCLQRHTAEIQPAFVRDIGRETPELFQLVEQKRRELIRRYFGGLFEDGKKTGMIRSDIPIYLIVEILLGAVQTIMNPPKLMELGLTVEKGYSSVIRLILEGALQRR